MNIKVTSVMLGLGLASGLAGAANAGGSYSDVGIKTSRDAAVAVPVPAPVPVPISPASWYLRADVGIGFAANPGVSESGSRFGTTDTPGALGPTPFGADPAWFSSDFKTFISGGIGAGYNWGRGFRTDITGEVRSTAKAEGIGSYTYRKYEFVAGPPVAYQPTAGAPFWVDGSVRDKTEVDTKIFLANAYYDVAKWGAFTPYVGAGIGFGYSNIMREHTWTQSDDAGNASTWSNGQKTHTFTLAAAAMAGVSYEFTPSVLLDLNYRFLWQQGQTVDLAVAGGTSRLTIADYGEHALRTGLRFNLD